MLLATKNMPENPKQEPQQLQVGQPPQAYHQLRVEQQPPLIQVEQNVANVIFL